MVVEGDQSVFRVSHGLNNLEIGMFLQLILPEFVWQMSFHVSWRYEFGELVSSGLSITPFDLHERDLDEKFIEGNFLSFFQLFGLEN